MALDARLADPVLLALAARRAKERQATAPRQTVTLKIVYYDALGQEPDECYQGPVYERVEGDDEWHLIHD
jgi:hypothetical protein